MSLTGTLHTGVSGLITNSKALNVIGDNISNINTVGFKFSRANFSEVLARYVVGSGGLAQIGSGVTMENVEQVFKNGTLQQTGKVTDLAISGKGFFMVNGNQNGLEGNFFTRSGQFAINEEGFLTTQAGMKVQGYQASQDGSVSNTIGDISISATTLEPLSTKQVNIRANLDVSEKAPTTIPSKTDLQNDPGSQTNFSTTITVYDSKGTAHQLEVHFTKVDDVKNRADGASAIPNDSTTSWNFNVVAKRDELDVSFVDVDPGTSLPHTGQYQQISAGTIDFNTRGEMISVNRQIQKTFDGSVKFVGAEEQKIKFDFQGLKPLNAKESTDLKVTGKFEITAPATEVKRHVVLYDKNGNSHTAEVLVKANGDFEVRARKDELSGSDLNKKDPNNDRENGALTVIASGNLTTNNNPTAKMVWEGDNLPPVELKMDFSGASIGAGSIAYTQNGSGSSGNGLTNYAAESAVKSQTQNGYSTGALQNISVDTKGNITGGFSNGQNRVLGQVALATFQNENGLIRSGGNLWRNSEKSGDFIIGKPGGGGRGSVVSSSLEQSNVDLADQFINLISAQRGFQASSRTITTTDRLLMEVTNLKRR